MNVYDFDHTIYNGDCTLDFWIYSIKKHPKGLLNFPQSIFYAILFKLHVCTREKFKEKFYNFLRYIPDVQLEVKEFWINNIKKIKKFYIEQADSEDIIISASPKFIIDEVCKQLGVRNISSEVDPFSGKLNGRNCRGEEKVKRFKAEYPKMSIDRVYFDSMSDIFLAKEAKEAFLVIGETVKKVSLPFDNCEIKWKIPILIWIKNTVDLYKLHKEILLYLFFGILTFLISVVAFFILYIKFEINELYANFFSWIIAVLFAYVTNKIWVFTSSTNTLSDYLKQSIYFFSGRLITLAIEEIILLIFITLLKMPSLIIKIVAQMVVIFLNYIISKKIVFK